MRKSVHEDTSAKERSVCVLGVSNTSENWGEVKIVRLMVVLWL